VIGIGGGILSGLIVTFISRAIFSRRDRREYAQRVLSANREVIYAVRPGVPEGRLPSLDVLDFLAQATARKYGVDRKDLYGPLEVVQELTKEVMDSNFISAEVKEEYCNCLKRLVAQPKTAVEMMQSSLSSGLAEYRLRMISTMSLMMGTLAAAMTLAFTFSRTDLFFGIFEDILPILATLITLVISVFFAFFQSTSRLRRIRTKEEKEASSGKGSPVDS